MKNRLNELLSGNGENYIFPFFWQHGEDEKILREYVRIIHDANIRAFCVESRPHPDFLGPKWWEDMDAILDEAQKLGMKVWILDDKHFPTGYAAGAVENAPPELCHQYLDYNTLNICGPMPCIQLNAEKYARPQPAPIWLPQPPKPKRIFNDDRLFRVLACPIEESGKIGDAIDLTSKVKDGWIIWNVPKGYWKIFVIYLTRDANGRNDYINFLDKNSCKLLIDTVYEPHYNRYKSLFGNVIAGFFSDEPPIGNTPTYTSGDTIGKHDMPLPWSSAMEKGIESEYGKGWEQMLALLWSAGSNKNRTAAIRTAYMNAVSKLVSECFSNQIGTWCEKHNIQYVGHMLEDCDMNANLGPSMGHFFRGLSGQHMAGIDNIGGQVLIGGQNVRRLPGGICSDDAGFYHYALGKLGSSMAAIDPKKRGRCMCENFGAYGWQIGVKTEKYLTDHFLARGVNYYVPHAFSPKDFPDPDCPPHFYAGGEDPQYKAFGKLMAYTNRVCHLIDGGKPETPVALLYHGESIWAGEYESNSKVCRELTCNQIGFSIIPADVFEKREEYNTHFCPQSKKLSINGIEFGALVISDCEFISRPAALFAADAIKAGFPVIFTGNKLIGASGADDSENAELMETLKKGIVSAAKDLSSTLNEIIKKSIKIQKSFRDLTVYHYENGFDVFLLLNENPAEAFKETIEISAKAPIILYDAWQNKAFELDCKEIPSGISVDIELEPLEMKILCCGDIPLENVQKFEKDSWTDEKILEDFTVSIAEAKEYPNFHDKQKADLKCGMGIAYPDFSGYFRYETSIKLEKTEKAILQIENVFDSAEVFVNGKSAELLVSQPFKYDISSLLTEGENHIAIEVATTLERKVSAMGADFVSLNLKAPLSPTGIIRKVILKIR